MRLGIVKIWLTMIACVMMCNGSVAQTSSRTADYKQLVSRLTNRINDPGVLATADSLLADGVRRRDVDRQWCALNVYMAYAFANKDVDMMTKYAQKQRDVAKKQSNYRYYFNPYVNETNMYISMQNYAKAFIVLSKMKKDAETLYGGKGLLDYYHLCGTQYVNTGKYRDALESYKKAIAFRNEKATNRDAAQLYVGLAMAYAALGDNENVVATANEGLRVSKGKSRDVKSICNLNGYKCFALNEMGKKKEAEETYLLSSTDRYRLAVENFCDIYHYCNIGEYDKAREIVNKTQRGISKQKWLGKVAHAEGNYEAAYRYQREAYMMRLDENKKQQYREHGFVDEENSRKELQEKNLALDLANAKLALEHANMALEHEKSLTEIAKANAENAALALDNKKLAVDKMEEENAHRELKAKQHRLLEDQKRRAARNMKMLVMHLFGFLILTAGALLLLQKRNQKRLEEAIIRTEESEKAKTLFLQNMSHEIRTPLNAIVGFSQILATQGDEFDEEQRRDFCNIVDQNTEMLTTLIDDILDVSALSDSSKGYTMQIGDCEANEMCLGAMASVRMRCPAGVKLYNTTDIEGLCPMKSDAKRVKQVLINFLTNAEKHTVEGEIRLHSSLTENPGMVTFSVTDTGEGVPADKAEAIFERFEKLDTFVQGTGLGLNICRQIATKLGGVVRLDTTYAGPGARFVFILPKESVVNNEKEDRR